MKKLFSKCILKKIRFLLASKKRNGKIIAPENTIVVSETMKPYEAFPLSFLCCNLIAIFSGNAIT